MNCGVILPHVSVPLKKSLGFVSKKTVADWCRSPQTGNREFVKQLATWTFGQRSVLKASQLRHRTANSTETPAVYRITDYIDFELDIQEYSHGKWGPFK